MEIIKNYASIINEAGLIAKQNLNNEDSINNMEVEKNKLLSQLEHDTYIKVPFVGDFDAGKSSILNSYMGIDLLPTNILPETAVAYELYYDTQERLELWHEGTMQKTFPLSKIKDISSVPGDIVKVYIANNKIKTLNDKNIVAVDMPGIDSGIEEHNNAILNYIQEGVHFVITNDIEQGTLRSTTISFVNELKKYGLSASVIVSKADKKPASEVQEIVSHIEKQAQLLISENVVVRAVSAQSNDTKAIDEIMESLNPEEIVKARSQEQISAFINEIIGELQLQIKLILTNKKDYSEKIQRLKDAKEKAIAQLQVKNGEAQDISDSASDILNDIHEALMAKSTTLAQMLYNSQNDTTLFNQEILSIIRPVLINSFKRELSEYQDTIGQVVNEFAVDVNKILQDTDNATMETMQDFLGDIIGKEVLENLLKTGLEKLIARFAGYKSLTLLLKSISKILGPLLTIVLNILPDILRLIFGKSKEQKIAAIQSKLTSMVFTKITDGLRGDIEKLLEEQRGEAMQNMEDVINKESKKYDDNIEQMKKEEQENKEDIARKVEVLQSAIQKLQNFLANL